MVGPENLIIAALETSGGTIVASLAGIGEGQMSHGDFLDIIRYAGPQEGEFGVVDDTLAPLSDGKWSVEYGHDLGDGWYSVRLIYGDGVSPVEDDAVPAAYALRSAYPNPFNPMVKVSYETPAAGPVSFGIYDIAGRKVWSQDSAASLPAGRPELVWRGVDDRGQSLPSGTYLLRMEAARFSEGRKLMLVR